MGNFKFGVFGGFYFLGGGMMIDFVILSVVGVMLFIIIKFSSFGKNKCKRCKRREMCKNEEAK